jgi:nitrite reductase (NADH) small subunit
LTQLHRVGRREDFPRDSVRIVEVAGREVGLIDSGGQPFAVLNVCLHQFGPVCRGTVVGTMLPSDPDQLLFGLENKVLRCRWHFWEFDLATGKALFGITKSRLLTFPVHIDGGEVRIEMRSRAQASLAPAG